MTEKHTPGPWCYGTFHRLLIVKAEMRDGELIPDKHYPIADLGPGDIPFDKTERSAEEYANAQLIAAAPDLLAALQQTKKMINEALPKFNWGNSMLDANAIAWLYSINPNKVDPAIRSKVIQYQDECDDVLWRYWTTGSATRASEKHERAARQDSFRRAATIARIDSMKNPALQRLELCEIGIDPAVLGPLDNQPDFFHQ